MTTIPGTKYVYRLEKPWADWMGFFGKELEFTYHRPIDELATHQGLPNLGLGQDYCGLWFLEDWSDAVKFWRREPYADSDEERIVSAYYQLTGQGGNYKSSRIFTRVVADALQGEMILPDKPLVYLYPSSRFALRRFDALGHSWSIDELNSKRVPHVSVPNEEVEVFYGGRWCKKNHDLGHDLLRDAQKRRDIGGFYEGLNLKWAV